MLGIPLLLTFFFVNLGAWRRGGGAEVEVADRSETVEYREVVEHGSEAARIQANRLCDDIDNFAFM